MNWGSQIAADAMPDEHGPPGWMSAPELAWLAREARTHRYIVEVGAWQGRATKALAEATPGRVVAVDNWAGENGSPIPGGVEKRFRSNLANEIESGKVMVLTMDSRAAASYLGSEKTPIDMVFIDADHEYPAPLYDIYAWRAVIQKDGLLCGHDYGLTGVTKSLEECRLKTELVGAGSIWRVRDMLRSEDEMSRVERQQVKDERRP